MKHLLFFAIAFAVFLISNSSKPEFCNLSKDEGTGPSFDFFLYYDAKEDKCKPFLFHGQGGNENRFKNERECYRNCSDNSEDIYPLNEVMACHFKKAPGECGSNLLRYYYDAVHQKCKKFFWTGCIGNGNRFTDQQICNKTCEGVHDEGNDPEEEETDTPIAIICGVLLAVIVVSIFITVIVLTVKSKKKHAKKEPGKSKDAQTDAPLRQDDIEMS